MKENLLNTITQENIFPLRSKYLCSVELKNEIYKATISTWIYKNIPVQPKMKNVIRIIDQDGKFVKSADTELELNSNIAYLANRLNSYHHTETITFYPSSHSQAVSFPHDLKKCKNFSDISKPNLVNQYYFLNKTMDDGFYYEFNGTPWKKYPCFLKKGVPFRKDMQFEINRKPDYRVPAEYVLHHTSLTHQERAEHFIESLLNLSGGKLIVKMENLIVD